jgi:hypothetical protein
MTVNSKRLQERVYVEIYGVELIHTECLFVPFGMFRLSLGNQPAVHVAVPHPSNEV